MFTTYFIYENIPFNGISLDDPSDSFFETGSSISSASNNNGPGSFDTVYWFLIIQLTLIFLGIGYFFLSLFGGKIYTLKKMQASACVDPHVFSLVKEISAEFHMKPPCVLIAKIKPNAFVFGYPKTLVISQSFLTTLSTQELRMVIKHELAHMKNLDIILKPVLQSLRIIFVHNPLIHLLYYKLIKERELMADLYYLHDQDDKILFMETLMKINAQIRNHYYPQSLLSFRESSLLSLIPREEIKVGISDRFNCLFGKTIRKTLITSVLIFVLVVMNIGMLGVSQGIMNSSREMQLSDAQEGDELIYSYTLVVKEQSSLQTICNNDLLLIQENTAYVYPSSNNSKNDGVSEPIEIISLYHQQIVKRISLSQLRNPASIWSSLNIEPVLSKPI